MDPLTAALIGILILIVIGGVWGYTIISGLMQRRLAEAAGGVGQAQLKDLRADHAQLESRLIQAEEELEFLKALGAPAPATQLPRQGGGDASG
jgi:hypothetical protein